jgi:hypothetical protein
MNESTSTWPKLPLVSLSRIKLLLFIPEYHLDIIKISLILQIVKLSFQAFIYVM